MAEALLSYIASVAPDVLCLQEVVHSPEADRDWLDYRDDGIVLPQRANFFRDVCAVLPGHFATFCPAARGACCGMATGRCHRSGGWRPLSPRICR